MERAKENPNIARKNYEEAAEIFNKHKTFMLETAKCLYSCEKFEEAKELFVQNESWAEAGETLLIIINNNPEKANLNKKIKNLYKEAIVYFDKAKKYSKALELSETSQQYQITINLLLKYQNYLMDFANLFENKLRLNLDYMLLTLNSRSFQ